MIWEELISDPVFGSRSQNHWIPDPDPQHWPYYKKKMCSIFGHVCSYVQNLIACWAFTGGPQRIKDSEQDLVLAIAFAMLFYPGGECVNYIPTCLFRPRGRRGRGRGCRTEEGREVSLPPSSNSLPLPTFPLCPSPSAPPPFPPVSSSQCCGSGILSVIPDPDFCPSRILDSKPATK
jgi:hypothetical protein